MATTGRQPSAAKPAAKVTACSSAMPTSKNRWGKRRAKGLSPVPTHMAAVTATIRLSASANPASASLNTSEYVF